MILIHLTLQAGGPFATGGPFSSRHYSSCNVVQPSKDYIETQHGKHSARVYKTILKNLADLEATSYKQFLKESASDFRVLACRVDEYDCKKDWSHISLYQGSCAQLNTLIGRDLSVVVGYV